MRSAICECTPVKTPRRGPPWGDLTLTALKKEKRKAYSDQRAERNSTSRLYYNRFHSLYRRYNRSCHRSYLQPTARSLRMYPRHFWSYMDKKRKSTGLPSIIRYDGDSACSLPEMCKLFALRFKDNFASQTTGSEDMADALSNTPVGAQLPMLPVINVDTITSDIKRVKSSYTPGPDAYPSIILKWCAINLKWCEHAHSLMKIFQASLRCGTFPATWKSSWMTPIYKKGCKNDAVIYRGITSLSVCAKVFEMLIYEPLAPFWNTSQIGWFIPSFIDSCPHSVSTAIAPHLSAILLV